MFKINNKDTRTMPFGHWFSDIFMGYIKRPMAWNKLTKLMKLVNQIKFKYSLRIKNKAYKKLIHHVALSFRSLQNFTFNIK